MHRLYMVLDNPRHNSYLTAAVMWLSEALESFHFAASQSRFIQPTKLLLGPQPEP